MFFAYFSISIPVFLLLICSGSWGSPGSASGKGSTCQCRRHKDAGSVPMSSRSLGTGSGNPLQYSCSKILADLLEQEVATHSNILLFHSRGARPAAVHGSKKSQTWLSTHIGVLRWMDFITFYVCFRYSVFAQITTCIFPLGFFFVCVCVCVHTCMLYFEIFMHSDLSVFSLLNSPRLESISAYQILIYPTFFWY